MEAVQESKVQKTTKAVLGFGLGSIVGGWTVIVPLIGIVLYGVLIHQAKAEKSAVPTKGHTGFWLCLLFGVAQVWTTWIQPSLQR